MNLKVFKIIEQTMVEGPGKRFCIWVQGCSRHCEGCFAKDTWDKKLGTTVTTQNIIERIKIQNDIEGVTFLGGEPFEQAKALAIIAKAVKNIGKSVVTFTGNKYEELLKQSDYGISNLLKYTDLLIDGGFETNNFDLSRPWVGSSNQRYIFLSNRYSETEILQYQNKVELRLSKDGEIFMNGMGNFNEIINKLSLKKR